MPMTPRSSYMTELRAAVSEILIGRDSVTLAEIETNLPPSFIGREPGRVTLAKAVTGLGWIRALRTGASAAAVYKPRKNPN